VRKLLSPHLIPVHGRPGDLELAAALRPPLLKTVDASPDFIARLHQASPESLLFVRDWALSEQHSDMMADPVRTGVRHAREIERRVARLNVPRSLLVFPGINEPRVWEATRATSLYYEAFLDELAEYGLRGAALNLSVGWPANAGPDRPPDWNPFEGVRLAILRGQGKHFLCLHEYWDHRGPGFQWRWWAGRLLQCPWEVPIIVGEAGLDAYVSDPAGSEHRRGWQGWMDAAAYMGQLAEYESRLASDRRVVGICVFTTDYNHPWASFDTEPIHGLWKAHNAAQRPETSGSNIGQPAGGGNPAVPPPRPQVPPAPVAPLLCHPIPQGKITQRFYQNPANYARFGLPGHNGTDFGSLLGTPVRAMAEGIVEMVGEDKDYGRYVRLWHEALKAHTFYAHLSEVTVQIGARVPAGARLGLCGSTGNSTGPHLHLEVRLGERAAYAESTPMPRGRVDPETWAAMLGLGLA